MLKTFSFAVVITCLAGMSCVPQKNTSAHAPQMDAARFLNNVGILASDSFLGRKPFTKGETLTVDFLINRFREAGATPGNGDSYVQHVPMVQITPNADSFISVKTNSGEFRLHAPTDYVVWTDRTESSIELGDAPVVFAGYGVVAPEYGWNDYEGLDVKGKVVLVMVNDPGYWNNDTTLFKGRTMTYYGRWTYKFEEAARQGAKACFVIHRTSAAGYPFRVVQNNYNHAKISLDPREFKEYKCEAVGWMTDTTALRLLKIAGYNEDAFEKANKKSFRPFDLNMRFSTSIRVKTKFDVSKNVIAKITGTKRPDEVIIYTAHWDHLGVGMPDDKGDSIYNGALDNATGTAGLLELANAFNNMNKKPERSIVFLAVTAEEQGLLGSEYYAKNAIYPAHKTVGLINMDVLNVYGTTNDLVVVGLGQSELEDYLANAATKYDGYIVGESRPETGGYFRSDHFNFAKIGIPALYAGSGSDIIGKGKAYGQKLRDEYTAINYHRPSDEINISSWKAEAAIRDLKILFEVGRKLSNEKKWPAWKPGADFRRH